MIVYVPPQRKTAPPVPVGYFNWRNRRLSGLMGFGAKADRTAVTCDLPGMVTVGTKCCLPNSEWDGIGKRCCQSGIFPTVVTSIGGKKHLKCSGDSSCTPDCSGKDCGGDGCGGSCGDCGPGKKCRKGKCSKGSGGGTDCTADCGGKTCGDDGCGGSCGNCDTGYSCVGGSCVFTGGDTSGGGGGGGGVVGGGDGTTGNGGSTGSVGDTLTSLLDSPVVWVAGGLLGVVLLVRAFKSGPAPIIAR